MRRAGSPGRKKTKIQTIVAAARRTGTRLRRRRMR